MLPDIDATFTLDGSEDAPAADSTAAEAAAMDASAEAMTAEAAAPRR